jgi:hypothetical protein
MNMHSGGAGLHEPLMQQATSNPDRASVPYLMGIRFDLR